VGIKYGTRQIYDFSGNSLQSKLITIPERVDGKNDLQNSVFDFYNPNASYLRWSFIDPIAIADFTKISGNGLYNIDAWDLNSKRISLYGNANSTPLWEYTSVPSQTWYNYLAISDTAGYIAAGIYQNIFIFNRQSNVPIFNFDLTVLPDTGTAGPLGITSKGNFIVACANRNDTSTIFGFSKDTNVSVWKYRVPTTIQGVKISGNDSLVIVNTYGQVWVFKTYTGQLIFQTPNTAGTQMAQGISGNGNLIALINYQGYLRVFQWNGSTYNFLWLHQEQPGTYYNWMTAVDISYDGQYIVCGTLNFVSSTETDGKIKLFHSTSSTPIWTFPSLGDEVQAVAISKNSKILVGGSWGDLNNIKDDFEVFKIPDMQPVPIFSINSPGSFFDCTVSNDGTSAIAGGKKVHARAFGYGGELYNIFIDTTSGASGINNDNTIPLSFKLYQNYPNPFNNQTRIEYDVPKSGFYKIAVHDLLGREVQVLQNSYLKGGNYSVLFNAENLASGIYIYKISSDKFNDMKRMVYVK
jgi:hypothetical protein